jgi:holo-[acyl-carrier protein] synthase
MEIRNGIDIIDIRRIKKTLNKYDFRFKKRCFHNDEIKLCDSRLNSAESYAKRYAAKEACAKALGTGLARGVFWKDIEVKNNRFGKPEIKLHNNALNFVKKISKQNNFSIEVSLSDEKNYAIANVIIYGQKEK